MSANTVKVFKLFWADQDVEQEIWLREMANKGLHLKSLNVFCQWTFERGAPADVAYQIDFTSSKDPHYNQLLRDDGWENAAELTGWQYWRKPVEDGVEPAIFTDEASKIQKFKSVLLVLSLLTLPTAMMVVASTRSLVDNTPKALHWSVLGFFAFYVPFMTYAVWRLWRRINASKVAQ